MRICITFPFFFFLFQVLALSVCAYSQVQPRSALPETTVVSPLWGDLRAGAYEVGFRAIFRFDASRTWKATRTYDGAFIPDLNGRPIQINVWYPASINKPEKRMRFDDYVDQSAPDGFLQFNNVMRQRNREDAAASVPREEIPALQATGMEAHRDAPAVHGQFPVVLYFGGLNAQINSNVVLAEYLASHGYIFASISLLGPSDQETFQSRTADDFESSVRDMEYAWSLLIEEPNGDRTRLAVMGHSVGAIEAVILGLRNADVSGVIALDGTYGFQRLSTVLTGSYGYAPGKMRAAFLDLRRAQGAQGDESLDSTVVESFRHADRTSITIDKMHHSDFTSFAMVGALFHAPLPANYPLNGWNRETGRAGYQQMCRIVLGFLDAKVKRDSDAMTDVSREVERSNGAVLRHEDAIPPPPSPLESAELANTKSLDAVETVFINSCGADSVSSCIDADRFNTWGYTLLGQHRAKEALAVFELNAWAHPGSANAQDSLADGYLAVGDKESARQAVERAIALAPADPTLDSAAKRSFLSEEKTKLQQFK